MKEKLEKRLAELHASKNQMMSNLNVLLGQIHEIELLLKQEENPSEPAVMD